EVLSSSGLIHAADASPDIRFPGGADDAQKKPLRARRVRSGTADELVVATREDGRVTGLREGLRLGLRGGLSCLFVTRGRGPHVVVVRESGGDELLQRVVFEDLPPRHVGDRVLLLRHRSPEIRRSVDAGPMVIGTNGATGQQYAREKNRGLHLVAGSWMSKKIA